MVRFRTEWWWSPARRAPEEEISVEAAAMAYPMRGIHF
jgi:hypothetical protein